MNKILEELAKLAGRAWAREWLETLEQQEVARRRSETTTRNANGPVCRPEADSDRRRSNCCREFSAICIKVHGNA
jgi:hypothetical protein